MDHERSPIKITLENGTNFTIVDTNIRFIQRESKFVTSVLAREIYRKILRYKIKEKKSEFGGSKLRCERNGQFKRFKCSGFDAKEFLFGLFYQVEQRVHPYFL